MYIPKKYRTNVLNDKELYNLYSKNFHLLSSLIPSNYDITKNCNMTCQGCLFFDGDDYKSHPDNASLTEWGDFFKKEKDRGVNYPYFAGAEPALVQDRLVLASQYFEKGLIFTNGSIKIDDQIKFKIHISVWGLPKTEEIVRNNSYFMKALKNYQNDSRALFVFTINSQNINEIEPIIQLCSKWNAKLSFNFFSPTADYLSKTTKSDNLNNLILYKSHLLRIRYLLNKYIDQYPNTLIYTKEYNHWVTNPNGLYIIDKETGIAKDCAMKSQKNNLHYRTDFTSTDSKCCMPNIDCTNCRAYAVSMPSAISRHADFFKTDDGFMEWNIISKQWRNMFL